MCTHIHERISGQTTIIVHFTIVEKAGLMTKAMTPAEQLELSGYHHIAAPLNLLQFGRNCVLNALNY